MTPSLSHYLDLLRILAALTVFLSHLSWAKISGGFLWQLQPFGHYGVMVFFVLSGFVIQHVAATRERDFSAYTVARLARLYSVVLPALLLTAVCDTLGSSLKPELYDLETHRDPAWRLLASGLFLSQSWGLNLATLSNGAFWSLPYEFWYYQMFGAAIFLSGWQRLVWLALSILLAGPAILLYLPIWLFGMAACRWSMHGRLPARLAQPLFALTLLALLGGLYLESTGMFPRTIAVHLPPSFSPIDYVIGGLVALNLLAAAQIALPLARFAGVIAVLAGLTFSLYLFHLPLLHLFASLAPDSLPLSVRTAVIALPTLGLVGLLGWYTERKKSWLAARLADLRRILPA